MGVLTVRCRELCEALDLGRDEIRRWDDVSRRLYLPIHGDGALSQFEGYDALEEFDWAAYRRKYGNIMRLDLILEAEGDSLNRYKPLCSSTCSRPRSWPKFSGDWAIPSTAP